MVEKQANKGNQVLWPGAVMDGELAPATGLAEAFRELLQQEQLADHDLHVLFHSLYLPMAAWLAGRQGNEPLLVGVNGSQGSGKSTLCKILGLLLEQGFDKRVVVISIDDLYLPRHERQQLASRVHPLLATRGVPGTHDVALAIDILSRLKRIDAGITEIPRFDKAMDDRTDRSCWQTVHGPVDIILFEGWCVGAEPQTEQQLQQDINRLEAEEDSNRQWRHFVNDQLAGPYHQLFSLIDLLVMLKIPDMKNVYEWRLLQENKLRLSLRGRPDAARHVMSEQQLERFIMHYERITRACLNEMPARADVVLALNEQHQVSRVIMNGV